MFPVSRLPFPGGSPDSRFPIPDSLRRLADSLLEQAKSTPPSRETALTLLAADALITWACEAVAEADPSAMGELR
ncbi:MAG: hypothetical protein ACE5PT_10250 [Gemmatimonadales bacterium]